MKNIFFIVVLAFVFVGCAGKTDLQEQQRIAEAIDSLRNGAKCAREKADFATAIELADSAWGLARECQDTIRMVQAMNELGTDFRRMGRMLQAVQSHSEALYFAEQCTDTSFQARKNVVVSWNGLGNALLTIGEDADAATAFHHALAGETELGSLLGQAINYANLGSIYERHGQLDSALYFYNESMLRNQQIESVVGMGLCHTYFGGIHEKKGDLDAALAEYQAAADLFVNEEDMWHAIGPTYAIANLYLQQGRIKEAEPLITKASNIAEQMGAIEHLAEVCCLKSQMHEMQGKDRLALLEYKQMMAYLDSIDNPACDRVMREIVLQYQRRKHLQQLEKEHSERAHVEHLYNMTIALGSILFVCALVFLIYILYRLRSKMQTMMERFHGLLRQSDMSSAPGKLSQSDSRFLENLHQYVEDNLEDGTCNVEAIAEYMGMSVSSLHRRIRLLTGDTPRTYVSNIRMDRAIVLLKTTDMPLRAIAMKCGFEDMSYFSRSIKKYTGKAPSQLRNEPSEK